jgi:probable phosphoglycerate mutase
MRRLLAESLAGMAGPVEKIFSSPLGRAFGTAEIIGRQLSLPVTVDERLVERNMGIFEGLSWESVREKYPGEFSKTVSNDNGYQIPEGESKSEYLEKVSSFLDFAATRGREK